MFASKDVSIGLRAAYPIARSVRFRSSATASLSRTFSTTGTSRQKFTLSVWVKRGILGATHQIMGCYDGSVGAATGLFFDTNDTLNFDFGGAAVTRLTTTQVFRDPSSWYHIMVACDTTQATAANRVILYINGVQVTAFSSATYPAQNANGQWMINTANNKIGTQWNSTSNWLDGYLAEMNFVDGQALTPSSFGAFNIYGVWAPAKYQGTYGTNGFYLKFADNSTAAALGTDSSGNSNTWTVNNISVTAGATYDSMTDVPTLTSATAANYCVFNPLYHGDATDPNESTYRNLSNGNLTVNFTSTGNTSMVPGTTLMSSGKWYAEFTWSGVPSATIGIITSNYYYYFVGNNTATGSSYGYKANGQKITNNTSSAYGASYTTGDVIGVAFDAGAGTLEFYKNNTSQGVAFTGLTGLVTLFAASAGPGACSVAATFGQRPFAYTAPTNFVALNTYNLSAPPIPNGAAYMAATLYTGTGSALSVSNTVNGTSFQPDFVWVKSRNNITNHGLFDVNRGVRDVLSSNTTSAEVVETAGTSLTSFDSSGFSLGTNGSTVTTNVSGYTFVAWQWKANGTGVSNTSGSITSTVSAGATQGFSVVTYTGTGANATVGHGLGVAPSMIIVKARSFAGADWNVYHSSTGNTGRLFLDTTAAFQTVAVWNNTSPTSSVFTVGGAYSDVNSNTQTYVAYCFAAVAGFSAFGSYTGNGSTDGPFVYLGFRPRWVLIKRFTDLNQGWQLYDNSRNPYNTETNLLFPDGANAEQAGNAVDLLSNGFKLRSSDTPTNSSGIGYIYAAFAENPFKYSLAR